MLRAMFGVRRRPRWLRGVVLGVLLVAAPGCVPRAGGRAERVASFDPDSIPEGYARSVGALAYPFAARAFEVTPGGDLYNGDWLVALRAAADGAPAGPPRAIAAEERWRPVLHWRRRSGEVRWDFEAAALPPAAADSGLFVDLETRATNQGSAPHDAVLEVALEPRGAAAPFSFFDAPDSGQALAWVAPGVAIAHGWIDGGATGDRALRSFRLAPGCTARLRLVLTAYPVPPGRLAAWSRATHARRVDEARRAWDALIARGASFELGDPEVEAALEAARVVLLACRERRGRSEVPIGSPFQYRDVWLRDGARAIAALAVSGYTRESRALADGLTLLQWPSGALLSQAGQLDGTGQALWAIGQAYLRPAPAAPPARVAAALAAGFRWCEAQRALSRDARLGVPGLLPFGDPHDNENVRAQLLGNDAWSLAGYLSAARLLRATGDAALADSIEHARAAYLAETRAALERTGSPDLPPSWQGEGLDWGNLAAAWPCGMLRADDPRCRALARRVWARAGGAGLASYRTPDSLSYYLGADLGTWALLAGERAAADSVLDAMLAYRSAGGGAAELFHRGTRDFGDNLPPHASGAAALTALVRNAIVFDDGDSLELTLGARERWWRGARVRGAPSRWGTLAIQFQSLGGVAVWRWTPVAVWSALHLPPGAVLAGAPAPPLRGAQGATVVRAPPGVGEARVQLARAPTSDAGRWSGDSKGAGTGRPAPRD